MQKNNNSKFILGGVLLVVVAALLVWAFAARGANAPKTESADSNVSTHDDHDHSHDTDTATDGSDDANQTAASSQASEETIVFTNDGFSPKDLTVKLGTKITVRNDSNQRVQFSSDDHPTHRINTGMNLRVLAPGESGTFTAGPVGTFGFHDHINDRHTGVLKVSE